jgi:type II secretory pathway pseudopilin PulG
MPVRFGGMQTQSTQKPWTRSEKALLWVIVLVVIGCIGGYLGWDDINALPAVTVPTPAMPSPNAFTYFLAAGNSLVNGNKIGFAIEPPSTVSPTAPLSTPDDHVYTLAQKDALVAENDTTLQLLHQGFSYPYMSPPVRSFTTLMPYYAPDRGLARLLFLQAQVQSAQGDENGAMNSCLDAVQEGEMLPHGGPMIGMLVGIACQAIGRRQAWALVDHLSAAQALTAAHRLERIDALHVSYADILQSEEWGTQAGLMEILRQPHWAGNFFSETGEDDTTSISLATRIQISLTPKRTIMHNYTAYMDQLVANAGHPYADKLPSPPLPTDPFNAILLPIFDGAKLKDVDSETQNALLIVTLALRAYYVQHGAYPATLNALVPQYLTHVPDDPFVLSGPLRYKTTGSTYVLYSIGPDGKDDGGKPIFDTTKPAPAVGAATDSRRYSQPDSIGDIVAGINLI